MCSRYRTPEAAEMARYYRIDKPNLGEIKPVIYPGYQTPVLLNANGDAPMIESRFWGFVLNMPGKRDPSQPVAKILQNAVSETVHEKRTFSKSWLAGQRCILPAVRFFEPVGGEFKPIYDPERPIISIAGIWAEQTYMDKKIQACTMLTTEPNGWMSEYHDRMPVILHPDDVSEWLSPDTAPDQAQKLCRPWSGSLAFAN